MEPSTWLIIGGLAGNFLASLGHLVKTITDNKVIKTELKNLTKELHRVNGCSVDTGKKLEHHIEIFHTKKD